MFEANDSLKPPGCIYDLLEKMGRKYCTFCNCKISKLIQVSHVWSVAKL